jgi:hypothetical protein
MLADANLAQTASVKKLIGSVLLDKMPPFDQFSRRTVLIGLVFG